MGMVKDLCCSFETLSKIERCASNGVVNIILPPLGDGEDPDGAIPLVFYPCFVVRKVDMAKF